MEKLSVYVTVLKRVKGHGAIVEEFEFDLGALYSGIVGSHGEEFKVIAHMDKAGMFEAKEKADECKSSADSGKQ